MKKNMHPAVKPALRKSPTGITGLDEITGERGEGNAITRYGLEEYVADCVITLDHRVTEQMSTRRLRVLERAVGFAGRRVVAHVGLDLRKTKSSHPSSAQ